MLKNIVSKFSDRGKEHSTQSENCDLGKVPEGFLCPKCLGSFANPELLQSHFRSHHEEIPPESPRAVTLQNFSAFYDDSAAEIEVEANGGSCGAISSDVEVLHLLDENELRKRLAAVVQGNALKDQKIKMLECRGNQLMQDYSALKAQNDKEKGVQNALQERIKVLEAQLTQRASLDDATALRHGLIQVQQAMDQMALDREKERDEYKEKLQCLEDTVNQEAEHMEHDKEKLMRVVKEYQQLQVKLKSFRERIVNTQLLINTNQFLTYEHALRRVKIQLEWLKSASKDAIVTNSRELKELKALLARVNKDATFVEPEEDDDEENEEQDLWHGTEFSESCLESTTLSEEFQALPDNLKSDEPLVKKELASESTDVTDKSLDGDTVLMALEKENKSLQCCNKELEKEYALQSKDVEHMKEKICDLEKKLNHLNSQLLQAGNEEATLKKCVAKLQQEKNSLECHVKDLEKKHAVCSEDSQKMNEKICSLEEKLKQLSIELSHSSEEEVRLKNNLSKLQQEKSSLEEEIETLQEKCNSQEEQIASLGVQRTSVETSLFELQKYFADLELEKANVEKCLGAEMLLLKEEKDRLENELEEIKVKGEEAKEKLITQETALKLKIETLEKEKQMFEENTKNLEQKLLFEEELKLATKKEMDELKRSITNFERQLEEQKKSHVQELDEKTAVLEMKQAALDEVAGEKLALEAQIETLQMEQKALLERCYASTSEAEHLRRTHVEACRSQEEVQAALQELGRENQTLQMKMDKLMGRKWAEDSEVTKCTRCDKEFSLIVRRHHCRNCFKIFCNECSSRVTAIEMDKKPVRVCEFCYSELAHK